MSDTAPMELTALDALEEVVKAPTIDKYLDRNPITLTDEDKRAMVKMLREERALFIKSKQEKKDKKDAG